MTTLGRRIKELRMKKGLTQIELAKGLCTPSMISQIESDRARPSYKILISIAERLDVPIENLLKNVGLDLEYSSTFKMAMGLVSSEQYKVAIPMLEMLLGHPKSHVSRYEICFELGKCCLEVGQYDQAISYFDQVVEWAQEDHNHDTLVAVLLQVAMVAMRNKELQLAHYHTLKALEVYKKHELNDPTVHSEILTQLAMIKQKMGFAKEAASYYEEAFSFSEISNSLEERGKRYLCLAQVHHTNKNFAKADEYATKALYLLDEVQESNSHIEWQRQLILLKKNDEGWKQAVEELLKFVSIYEERADHIRAGELYADIAAICLQNSENENNALAEAWGYAEKARLILPYNHEATANAHRVLSSVHIARGNFEKGIKHLENAIAIYEQLGLLSKLEETILQLCNYLSENGKVEEAFQRLQNFHGYLMDKLEERGVVL